MTCSGGDVVFAKLWLARHWVVGPDVELICFDAGSPWPIAGRMHGMVLCHDAFYFLEPKAAIATRLRDATAPGGVLALAHIHNAEHLEPVRRRGCDGSRPRGALPGRQPSTTTSS